MGGPTDSVERGAGPLKRILALLAVLAGAAPAAAGVSPPVFVLRPEWTGPCTRADPIDVNLGNAPGTFVRACGCQATGHEPDAGLVAAWARRLAEDPALRRIDVVRSICRGAGREKAALAYSNPWLNDPELPPAPPKTTRRDVGAVLMFFFHCPGGVNCGMDWANTHAPGMETPAPELSGYYDPHNPGFWRRELRDGKSAGLDFFLLNTYGPDLQEGGLEVLVSVLGSEAAPLRIGLFDDTWAWGEKWFGPSWQAKPDLGEPQAAAARLYAAKWKPFFSRIPPRHWYRVAGRPMIYFYNAGKLEPRHSAAAVLARMKEMFRKDFGIEPFLAVDRAYFEDPAMPAVADARFIWDPLKYGEGDEGMSRVEMKGRVLCHAMVRWDSVGRDRPGAVAESIDHVRKGPELLTRVLRDSTHADILVLATWNDLGEGTGLNRNYDYYHLGRWLEPDYFMRLIAQAQSR